MSRSGLWSAVIGAVEGIVPTRIRDAGYTLHDQRHGDLEECAQQMRRFELRVSPGSGLLDTGHITAGGALDLVGEAWEIRVSYPAGEEPDAADWTATISRDAADIIGAVRPPDVWDAHGDDLSVLPETSIDEIIYPDGGRLRLLTVRLTVRYAP